MLLTNTESPILIDDKDDPSDSIKLFKKYHISSSKLIEDKVSYDDFNSLYFSFCEINRLNF